MRTYLKDCRWGRFLLLRGDMISEHVNLLGEWCEAEVELFRSLLCETSDVIEVGANIGMHAVPLAKFACKGRLHCYEPQRVISQILCANLALNGLGNAHVFQKAVGAQAACVEIAACDYDRPWNYGAFSVGEGFDAEAKFPGAVTREIVETTTIDIELERRPLARLDLIKIDAEGAEGAAIRGAEGAIARHRPYIFAEVGGGASFEEVFAGLKARGYACHWLLAKRARPGNFNGAVWSVEGADANMLAVPEGRPLTHALAPVSGFADLVEGRVVAI